MGRGRLHTTVLPAGCRGGKLRGMSVRPGARALVAATCTGVTPVLVPRCREQGNSSRRAPQAPDRAGVLGVGVVESSPRACLCLPGRGALTVASGRLRSRWRGWGCELGGALGLAPVGLSAQGGHRDLAPGLTVGCGEPTGGCGMEEAGCTVSRMGDQGCGMEDQGCTCCRVQGAEHRVQTQGCEVLGRAFWGCAGVRTGGAVCGVQGWGLQSAGCRAQSPVWRMQGQELQWCRELWHPKATQQHVARHNPALQPGSHLPSLAPATPGPS